MTDKKRVAIYCRVANEDDATIKYQEAVVRRFAEKNGFSDFVCYCDNGVSGLRLDRPGMNKLMDDIRNGLVGTVIVKCHDRVARGIVPLMDWLEFMGHYGVRYVTVSEGETPDRQGKLLLKMQALK